MPARARRRLQEVLLKIVRDALRIGALLLDGDRLPPARPTKGRVRLLTQAEFSTD